MEVVVNRRCPQYRPQNPPGGEASRSGMDAGARPTAGLITRKSRVRIPPPLLAESPANAGVLCRSERLPSRDSEARVNAWVNTLQKPCIGAGFSRGPVVTALRILSLVVRAGNGPVSKTVGG